MIRELELPVVGLGLCPVKGTTWHEVTEAEVLGGARPGLAGDREWAPVLPPQPLPDGSTGPRHCVKATEVPWLAGVRVEAGELPGPGTALGPAETVYYYRRPFTATVHDGPVAQRITAAGRGRELHLAHCLAGRFIWADPVSVLLLSELDRAPGGPLPRDTGRYRPNVVLDDREHPVDLAPGDRLRVGEALLEVAAPLDRCLVVNHSPVTGERDADLLRKLRPGVLLAWGCRVLDGGRARLSATP